MRGSWRRTSNRPNFGQGQVFSGRLFQENSFWEPYIGVLPSVEEQCPQLTELTGGICGLRCDLLRVGGSFAWDKEERDSVVVHLLTRHGEKGQPFFPVRLKKKNSHPGIRHATCWQSLEKHAKHLVSLPAPVVDMEGDGWCWDGVSIAVCGLGLRVIIDLFFLLSHIYLVFF